MDILLPLLIGRKTRFHVPSTFGSAQLESAPQKIRPHPTILPSSCGLFCSNDFRNLLKQHPLCQTISSQTYSANNVRHAKSKPLSSVPPSRILWASLCLSACLACLPPVATVRITNKRRQPAGSLIPTPSLHLLSLQKYLPRGSRPKVMPTNLVLTVRENDQPTQRTDSRMLPEILVFSQK